MDELISDAVKYIGVTTIIDLIFMITPAEANEEEVKADDDDISIFADMKKKKKKKKEAADVNIPLDFFFFLC